MPRAERLLLAGVAALALAGPTSAAEKRAVAAPSYLEIPPLTASIIRPEGGRGVLTLGGGLDAPDPKLRERANLSKPRLIDAYSQTLRRYASGLSPGRPPDLEVLGRQLQQATDRTLGRPGARFLFQAVVVN